LGEIILKVITEEHNQAVPRKTKEEMVTGYKVNTSAFMTYKDNVK
jgi:hypothetical protein